jgi:hypothetical protein
LPGFAQKANTPDPKIIEQLDVLLNKTSQAFRKGDAIGLAALYTEDAIMEPGDFKEGSGIPFLTRSLFDGGTLRKLLRLD